MSPTWGWPAQQPLLSSSWVAESSFYLGVFPPYDSERGFYGQPKCKSTIEYVNKHDTITLAAMTAYMPKAS